MHVVDVVDRQHRRFRWSALVRVLPPLVLFGCCATSGVRVPGESPVPGPPRGAAAGQPLRSAGVTEHEIRAALAAPGPVSARPMPRGVAHPAGRVAFIAAADDAIVAVDLERGRVIWTAGLGGQPVMATDGGVVIARPLASMALGLVLLDASDGHHLGRCDVRFPSDVDVVQMLRAGGLAPIVEGGRLVVDWEVRTAYRGGASPPPSIEQGASRLLAGRFHCEFGSERREASVDAKRPALRESFGYRRGGRWHHTAWRVEGPTRLLARLAQDSSGALVLETFEPDGARARPATPIGENSALDPTVTPDGRFLFVRRTVPPGERWRIWSVTEHEQIASIPYLEGSDFPAVLERRAYHLAPAAETGVPSLRALDLATGDLLWELALGSPVEREPPRLPPVR